MEERALEELGWSDVVREQFRAAAASEAGAIPARVMLQERGLYVVRTGTGEYTAEVSGRFRHRAVRPDEYPAVGDWVVARLPEGEGRAQIAAVLPRRTKFSRKVAGERTEEQIVAANVDVVFLVSGLDGDFNPRRIERYLTATWDSGAVPVVLLNKADICDDVAARVEEVESIAIGVDVCAVSAARNEGLDVVRSRLARGTTIAFLGSSGVGKSTIINALLGREAQETQEVRADDARGRHTTTRRQLFVLDDQEGQEGSGLVLDTPGMRELQLWDEGGGGVDASFEDIVELAESCRFRDCGHDGEPGCAVSAAIEGGDLDAARLASYRKLEREMRFLESRRDKAAQAEERRRIRDIHKTHRQIQRISRRRKGD